MDRTRAADACAAGTVFALNDCASGAGSPIPTYKLAALDVSALICFRRCSAAQWAEGGVAGIHPLLSSGRMGGKAEHTLSFEATTRSG